MSLLHDKASLFEYGNLIWITYSSYEGGLIQAPDQWQKKTEPGLGEIKRQAFHAQIAPARFLSPACTNEITFFFYQKTEPWETEVSNEEQDSDEEEDKIPEKRPKRRKQLKLVDGVLYRVNQYGKYFKYFINVKD